jgi:hypothetical protein
MPTKICAIQGCNYPEGECAGLCWHPEERRMDIIGQNGNDGLHYEPSSKVCVVIIENGKITLDYMSSWITGNGTEQLERAKKMIDMVIGKKQ